MPRIILGQCTYVDLVDMEHLKLTLLFWEERNTGVENSFLPVSDNMSRKYLAKTTWTARN